MKLRAWTASVVTAAAAMGTAHAATTVEYLHTDALGTPIAVTNESRVILERSVYRPYGLTVSGGAPDKPGYAGHVRDGTTGLSYMQQRYYDSQLGLFLSVDPVTAFSTGDMRQFGRYVYAFNSPYQFSDPDGRFNWEIFSDAFKVEVSGGGQLEAKAKIGHLAEASVGLGAMAIGVGATGNDLYTFEEAKGPSLGLVVGNKLQFGWAPTVGRSEQGRFDLPEVETKEEGGFAFGLKTDSGKLSNETKIFGPSPTEFSAKLGALLGSVEVKVDVGQAAYGFFVAKPDEESGQKIQARLQWDEYKRDVTGKAK